MKKQEFSAHDLAYYDPKRFNDPVAACTEWQLVGKSWLDPANDANRLAVKSENRRTLSFQSASSRGGFVISASLAAAVVYFFMFLHQSICPEGVAGFASCKILGIISLFFLLLCFFYREYVPIMFDKNRGLFYKGWSFYRHETLLRHIHALQLVSDMAEDYVPDSRNDFYRCYEMNLVLHNAGRIRVAYYHNNAKALRHNAEKLADFLSVPVWDMSQPDLMIPGKPQGKL